eukprot:CAMPEP_0194280872 /NCGR_PEP_ID=MMETSP0169-20130528/19114_1 /TAXON_ID=218684 /ORGANISM="Corethron pennatum, Strain L29A3" /LENGTH=191 /DNA_ID=CAMNT_0039025765 /DNA_START=138 /DNA_END=713 /DNA_ORIENTATION=-
MKLQSLLSLFLVAPLWANAYISLEPKESFEMWQNGTFSALIDVRREDEYVEGHIAGAVFAKELNSATILPEFLIGCENCTVGVYCKSGSRSKVAAKLLEDNGFARVYDLLGVKQMLEEGDAPFKAYNEVGIPEVAPVAPCATTQIEPTCSVEAPMAPLASSLSSGNFSSKPESKHKLMLVLVTVLTFYQYF